jgi:hypothetical protein
VKDDSIADNVRTGIRIAHGFALVFTMVAAVVLLSRDGMSAWRILVVVTAFYFATATIAGAVVGALGPSVRGTISAMVVAIIACVPIAIGGYTILHGLPHTWNRGVWNAVAIFSLFFGGMSGAVMWSVFRPASDDSHKH